MILRNPKYWRERTLETERKKLAQLIKADVLDKLFNENRLEKELQDLRRVYQKLGLSIALKPTYTHRIRRLKRKIKRIENGTYRRRHGDR